MYLLSPSVVTLIRFPLIGDGNAPYLIATVGLSRDGDFTPLGSAARPDGHRTTGDAAGGVDAVAAVAGGTAATATIPHGQQSGQGRRQNGRSRLKGTKLWIEQIIKF